MHQDYQHRSRLVLIAVILTGLALVAGCRGQSPSTDTSSSDSDPINAETTEAPAPTLQELEAGVFFIREGNVGYAQRTVSVASQLEGSDPELLTPILEALIAGPSPEETDWGFASAIPPDTKLLGVSTSATLATVNVNEQFTANSDTLSMRQRVAQVVFTLTALNGVERVAFEIDGEPLRVPRDDAAVLGPSVSRDDFADVRPDILIVSPAPGEEISSPVQVSGESNTPGGTFVIEIIGTEGTPVTEQLADGGGTNGTWHAFETSIEFDTGTGPGDLIGYGRLPTDGSRTFEIHIPVVFTE